MFGGRVSRRTTCRCRSINSAASSIVTTRSSLAMKPERMLSSVVLPAPVPPETRMLSRAPTAAFRNSSIGCVSDSRSTRSWAPSRSVRKRRIDIAGPSSASGGMMTLTREPSCSRASTIGVDSSMRRPTALTMRSMICIRCLSSRKTMSVSSMRPFALDVDLRRLVDQDVRDARVLEQRLERPKSEQLVEDVADERLALVEAERDALVLAVEQVLDDRADLRLGVGPRGLRQPIQVQPIEQILMDLAFERLVLRLAGIGDGRCWGGHSSLSVLSVGLRLRAAPGKARRACRGSARSARPCPHRPGRAARTRSAFASLPSSSTKGIPVFAASTATR